MCSHPAAGIPPLEYRRYRAPAGDGERLFDPPWPELPGACEANASARAKWQCEILGVPIQDLALAGRQELLAQAMSYTASYLPAAAASVTGRGATPLLVMSGHQPRMFHPGVWWKNAVLSRLATAVGGLGINWVVDNDLAGPSAIRVPAGTTSQPRLETIPYDDSQGELPFEETHIANRDCWESFGTRTCEVLQDWIAEPLLRTWWPEVVTASRDESNPGYCLAQARHRWEFRAGLRTLELPLSRSCDSRAFRTLILHLFRDLARYQEIHNEALREYRQANRIRSRSHPVPALERDAEGWLEAPLWLWTPQLPRRRRLWIRSHRGMLELSDRESLTAAIPAATAANREEALAALADLASRGWRLRPRALLTTLLARVLLSDLFVHGIGGGKYDQLNDAIMARWLGVQPPRFVVTTATARLPIPRPRDTVAALREVGRRQRELTQHPERSLPQHQEVQGVVAELRDWLAQTPARGQGRPRQQALQRLRSQLREPLQHQAAALERRRQECLEHLRQERLLGSREFAFCLFPEVELRRLLLDTA